MRICFTKSQLTDFYNQSVKGGVEGVKLLETAKPVIPIVETGKVSGIAKSVEAKAIEQGLTDKGFSELAEYSPAVIKEQSQIMSDLMGRDLEQAKRIALGKEEPIKGLKTVTAFSAMEDWAMAHKDGALARDLANSPIATEISVAGQSLRLAGERTPDSATAKIKEIQSTREKVSEKRLKGMTAEKAKTEIKNHLKSKIASVKPSKYDLLNLLEEIKC